MPYKSKNISFGATEEFVGVLEYQEAIESLQLLLGLEKEITAVKLINSEEEYEKIGVPTCQGKMSYCQMILQGTKGKIQKSKIENHSCDGGTTALGLEQSRPKIENGDEYFSYNLYETKAAARRMRSHIKGIPYNENQTYGVLTGAAKSFIVTPDVLIIVTNPYQTMRLVQGYEYSTGIKPQVDLGAMQGLCSELTSVPLMNGSMNVSVFCPSTRMLCQWEENEMGVAIPFEQLFNVVAGVLGTLDTTENKGKKEKIVKRFSENGKEIKIDSTIGYK